MLPHATLYKLGMKNECLYFNAPEMLNRGGRFSRR